jgi:hypothetical protein
MKPLCASTQRIWCPLVLPAFAKAHLRAQAKGSASKSWEANSTKRTHLTPVKSIIYVFRKQRKQGSFVDNRRRRRGGAQPGHARPKNLAHGKESCHVASRVTWNEHFIGRKLSLRVRGGYARGKGSHPSWTTRFPDPEGRQSATPFPCRRATFLRRLGNRS